MTNYEQRIKCRGRELAVAGLRQASHGTDGIPRGGGDVPMKVLISIKPDFVERIFSGEKKYEFRKRNFSRCVNNVVVYSCAPVGRVVGEFSIGGVLEGTPNEIWRKCRQFAGITKKEFNVYFSGRSVAYAIEIHSIVRYPKKLLLSETYHCSPPQSFIYIRG